MLLNNLVHHQFTEKVSKASKSSAYKRGVELERLFSKIIHKNHIPVLVSSKILREIGCGQVDLCSYQKGHLILYEVKSCQQNLGFIQNRRLLKSLDFMTAIFNSSGEIVLLNNLPKD